jgi:cold shock protein
MRGTVRWFNAARGYGFIQVDGRMDVFVHDSKVLKSSYRPLQPGDVVDMEIMESERGPEALNVVRNGL